VKGAELKLAQDMVSYTEFSGRYCQTYVQERQSDNFR